MDLEGLWENKKIYSTELTKLERVFLLKWIEDLFEFIAWPDQVVYFLMQLWMQKALERVALPKMRRSSAKRRWEIAGQFLTILRPFNELANFSLRSSQESTSAPRMKRKGDRGSPWLKPLEGENKSNGLPLIRMENEEEELQTCIQLIHIELKPSFFIMARRIWRHKATIPFLVLESMQELMSQDRIILDISIWNKGRLQRGNNLG